MNEFPVHIESHGYSFEDALAKLHYCKTQPAIGIRFQRSMYDETKLTSVIVDIEGALPMEFQSADEALAYVKTWMDRRIAAIADGRVR